jgi:hemolysin activation/secretion protein
MVFKGMLYVCASYFLLAALLADTPPPPSAGIIERELEKEYEQQPFQSDRESPPIQIDIPEEKLEIPEGKKIFIRKIKIEGNESISTKKVLSWIKSYLKKDLSLKEIYEVCRVIDQHYAKEGYFLARAYPPPQAIENGTLVIKILEGRLGTITVVGNKYYKTAFIRSYFSSLVKRSLHREEFMRALMLLNENSDLSATAIFEKGKEFGCADVIIKVKDTRPVHLYLNGNNYGKDLTTNSRAGGRFDWGNILRQGDTFSVAEVVGFPVNALFFTDLTYKTLLNKKGASLTLGYLFSDSKNPEYPYLDLRGSSRIAKLKFNQALRRAPQFNTDMYVAFDYKQIRNSILSYETSFDKLRILTLGTLVDSIKPSKGRDSMNLSLAAGIPNLLGGLAAIDPQSSRQGGGGRFFQLNLDYTSIRYLPKDCMVYFHTTGQLSPNYLTVPQQIYIGGIDTVRGFPLAVGLGDSGYYLNMELHLPPPLLKESRFFWSKKKWKEVLQFVVFVDHGGVFLQSVKNTFLTGSGVGFRINHLCGLSLSVDVGFPLNNKSLTKGAFTYVKLTAFPF